MRELDIITREQLSPEFKIRTYESALRHILSLVQEDWVYEPEEIIRLIESIAQNSISKTCTNLNPEESEHVG